jgi:hypothetical protein
VGVRLPPFLLLPLLLPLPRAAAQWSPANGQWLESDARDLRVMTWNTEDSLCSTNAKVEGPNAWTALARIVASLQPDLLILQECGDNSGNGTGNGVDSPTDLAAVLDMFVRGGADVFHSGAPPVTAFVRLYAPGYDLPYVFVGLESDGFNRNVILSRFPFADLNGDGLSVRSDIPTISPDEYAPGGNGGLRGYPHAEIDLPDALYRGDLVLGNSHLKAGSAAGDHTQRVVAAQNIAYYLDWFYCGGGGAVPDPHGKVDDQPPAPRVLEAHTLVLSGGDLNEDEVVNGAVQGPAAWIELAQFADGLGPPDGPDRDRSDLRADDAADVFTGSTASLGNVKYDYLVWQDSVADERRAFVFRSGSLPPGAFPPPLAGWPSAAQASTLASDHRPVVVDLILPPPAQSFPGAPQAAKPPGQVQL